MTIEEKIANNGLLHSREGSKESFMFRELLDNISIWDIGRQNRWIGYAQALLVVSGSQTLQDVRDIVRFFVEEEKE